MVSNYMLPGLLLISHKEIGMTVPVRGNVLKYLRLVEKYAKQGFSLKGRDT